MRRFRLLFALFAVALLVPLGLLVERALRSADMEQQLQYRTVAERVFDEMERTLSEMLAREEARPFEAFAAPIATELPFVVGHFQVEPDGTLGGVHAQRKDDVRDRLEATVTSYFRSGAREKRKRELLSQLPGTTMEVGKDRGGKKNEDEYRKDEKTPAKAVSAFDALRSLNKGVQQRGARVARRAEEYASAPLVAPSGPSSDLMDAPAAAGGRALTAYERLPRPENEMDDRLASSKELLTRELPPMTGRMVDHRDLLLHRTVVQDTRGYQQGVLIDVSRLAMWLRDEVLAGSELEPYTSVSFESAFVPAAKLREGRVYAHRFAEPFDDVATRLVLRTLPGVGGPTYLRVLAALLVGASLLGLIALYRMVSVVISFAERRGNFVAAVSHELKTPLTAIRMYGEMLRDGIVPSEAKRDEYHRHITTEAERLSRLINNVLEFSHLEKGTRQVSLVNGSIAPVVEEIAELLRPHVAREGFELRVELEPDLPPVRFERDALVQMIFNLVDNAVKYAKDSTPRLVVLQGQRDGAGVRLTVRDHGPGVPSRHLGKIFEPFYRGESESTRRSKGTGIGLALVRGLADCMNATVAGANVSEGGFAVEIRFEGA